MSELNKKVELLKSKLGDDLLILAHHYQRDEIVSNADIIGDSLALAQASAESNAKQILFCGVHFMAETADILTKSDQNVYLPNLKAGCFMANMATKAQLENAWNNLANIYGENNLLPITYVNSTADVKAFVGKKSGATLTSSNASKVVQWALNQNKVVLFLPDQHLGRNTASALNISLQNMAIVKRTTGQVELSATQSYSDIKVLLWDGYCAIHQRFNVYQISEFRAKYPNGKVIVHPECPKDVVDASDLTGSTNSIIETIKSSDPQIPWAVGTEGNLVNRLSQMFSDRHIESLDSVDKTKCLMMEQNTQMDVVNCLDKILNNCADNHLIKVDPETASYAKLSLDKMLELK